MADNYKPLHKNLRNIIKTFRKISDIEGEIARDFDRIRKEAEGIVKKVAGRNLQESELRRIIKDADKTISKADREFRKQIMNMRRNLIKLEKLGKKEFADFRSSKTEDVNLTQSFNNLFSLSSVAIHSTNSFIQSFSRLGVAKSDIAKNKEKQSLFSKDKYSGKTLAYFVNQASMDYLDMSKNIVILVKQWRNLSSLMATRYKGVDKLKHIFTSSYDNIRDLTRIIFTRRNLKISSIFAGILGTYISWFPNSSKVLGNGLFSSNVQKIY